VKTERSVKQDPLAKTAHPVKTCRHAKAKRLAKTAYLARLHQGPDRPEEMLRSGEACPAIPAAARPCWYQPFPPAGPVTAHHPTGQRALFEPAYSRSPSTLPHHFTHMSQRALATESLYDYRSARSSASLICRNTLRDTLTAMWCGRATTPSRCSATRPECDRYIHRTSDGASRGIADRSSDHLVPVNQRHDKRTNLFYIGRFNTPH
jgi:hypothetical protein